jgi:hypothetical protein
MMCHPALNDAVFAINMQRGRDAASNQLRDAVIGLSSFQWDEIQRRHGFSVGPKHRGFIMAMSYACFTAVAMLAGPEHVGINFELLSPSFFSYRSGVLTYDSVVMDSFSRHFKTADEDGFIWGLVQGLYEKDAATGRRISATLATRTRRGTA